MNFLFLNLWNIFTNFIYIVQANENFVSGFLIETGLFAVRVCFTFYARFSYQFLRLRYSDNNSKAHFHRAHVFLYVIFNFFLIVLVVLLILMKLMLYYRNFIFLNYSVWEYFNTQISRSTTIFFLFVPQF